MKSWMCLVRCQVARFLRPHQLLLLLLLVKAAGWGWVPPVMTALTQEAAAWIAATTPNSGVFWQGFQWTVLAAAVAVVQQQWLLLQQQQVRARRRLAKYE
jgi:hypothetical protein